MRRQIITDNTVEKLEIVKEDELYGLVHLNKNMYPEWRKEKTIVLNSREAQEVAEFIFNQPTTFKFRNETKKEVIR